MLSRSLFNLCLLLAVSKVLSSVVFPVSDHEPAMTAEPAATTEMSSAAPTILCLPQSEWRHPDSVNSLHRRGYDMHVLNNGWRMKFLRIDSGLPLSIASALLEDFYERVLAHVHQFAITVAPLRVVSVHVLDLYLEFWCDSGEVSWDFIEAFVTTMLDATRRGFTGKFEAVVFHDPTATAINVALQILRPAERSDSTETTTGP